MRTMFRRRAINPQVRRQGVAVPLQLPMAGWNTRDALTQLEPVFASRLDNVLSGVGGLELRRGHREHATGVAGGVVRLMSYQPGGTGARLFAASSNSIYDATNPGDVGQPVREGFSSGDWTAINFADLGGVNLIAANGEDPVQRFTGAVWSAPEITGPPSTNVLKCPTAFQRRLWFIQRGTLSAWYMDNVLATQGSATEFNFGPLFNLGGELVSMATWTRDGGDGMDDLLVLVTSEGQTAVYSGATPLSMTLLGIYRLPRPIGGGLGVEKVGGELVILTEAGPYPMSAAVSGQPQQVTLSEAIQPTFREATQTRGNLKGWQILYDTNNDRIIVNVPQLGITSNEQYVFVNRTAAWCRFTGVDSSSWIMHDGDLYIGRDDGEVHLADVGGSDDGAPITGRIYFAPQRYGSPDVKEFLRVRLHWDTDSDFSQEVAILLDYDRPPDTTSDIDLEGSGDAEWNVSEWNVTDWAGTPRAKRVTSGLRGTGTIGALAVTVTGTPTQLRLDAAEITVSFGRRL